MNESLNKPDPLQTLLRVLDLTPLGDDRFEGRSAEFTRKRMFGGELVAQSLVAGQRTVEGKLAHSIHCHFLLPGDPAEPVEYRVRRLRDGRRFAQRQISAWQKGREIFLATASFGVADDTVPGHQHLPMPKVAGPEGLTTEADLRRQIAEKMPAEERDWLLMPRAVQLRHVRPMPLVDPPIGPPTADTWMRAIAALPDDQAIHQAVLAFASDMTLLDIAFFPHGRSWIDPRVEEASLDHALWFHHPFRFDDWMLFSQESTVLSNGRAYCRGSFFTGDGRLAVSATQEGLTRVLG